MITRSSFLSRFASMIGATALLVGLPLTVQAAPVIWTDWTSGTTGDNGSANGVLNIDGTLINVAYSGEISFLQTGSGPNYWTEPVAGSRPYTSASVDNAPLPSEMIALSKATSKTLTFSQPVQNLLFSVISLNGNGYQFDRDFDIVSYGNGYWGNGTLTKQALGNGLFQLNGTGEPHGIIEFQGGVSSITWTSLTNEYWNGFTVGVRGAAPAVVPESNTVALLSLGALPLVGLMVRRRTVK